MTNYNLLNIGDLGSHNSGHYLGFFWVLHYLICILSTVKNHCSLPPLFFAHPAK